MKPYKSSNIVPKSAWKWLIVSSLFGGAAIGIMTFAISQIIYLIVLFPLGMGLAGGVVNSIAIQQGKVRNSLVSYIFGAMTGLSIYGTVHVGEYLIFKQKASEEISPEFTQIDNASKEKIFNEYLKQETGAEGFWGYLKYSAKQGVSIGKIGREGIKLDETFTWLYWLIELAAIQGLIIYITKSASQDPFCESCQQWYKDKERIGNVDGQLSGNFLELINKDNFSDSGKLVNVEANIPIPSLELYIQCCPSCKDSDLVFTVSKASLDKEGKLELEQTLQGMITRNQEIQIRENIQNRETKEI